MAMRLRRASDSTSLGDWGVGSCCSWGCGRGVLGPATSLPATTAEGPAELDGPAWAVISWSDICNATAQHSCGYHTSNPPIHSHHYC